jgi:heme-degrading monooxygenase HmoA
VTDAPIAIVWEFVVPAANRARFETAYGADGDWAQLFRRAPDFLGTELLRDGERDGVYLTIDRWASAEAFGRFKRAHGADYERLDAALEGLAGSEARIGLFREAAASKA